MVDTEAEDAAPKLSMQSYMLHVMPILGHSSTMAISVQAVLLYELVSLVRSVQRNGERAHQSRDMVSVASRTQVVT